MVGLLQYKPKSWEPYAVGCIEHPDECRVRAEGY